MIFSALASPATSGKMSCPREVAFMDFMPQKYGQLSSTAKAHLSPALTSELKLRRSKEPRP
jgi:hypothetical protein